MFTTVQHYRLRPEGLQARDGLRIKITIGEKVNV